LAGGVFGVLVGLGNVGGEGHAGNGSFGLGIVACGGLDGEGTAKFQQVKERECFWTFTAACVQGHFLHLGDAREAPMLRPIVQMTFLYVFSQIQTIGIAY